MNSEARHLDDGARRAPAARRSAIQQVIDEDALDLREMMRTVWRNRRVVALLTFVQLMLAVWYVASATPYYSATAKVMLDTSEEKVIDLQSVVGGLSSDYEMINTQIEVMQSRNLLDRVVAKLELEKDPEFNPDLLPDEEGPLDAVTGAVRGAVSALFDLIRGPQTQERPASPLAATEYTPEFLRRQTAIDILQGSVMVTNVDGSYVFEITAVTEDPMKSAAIANAVADQYILDQLEVKFEATQQATTWLSQRVAELKDQLEKAERAVKDHSAAASLVSEEALAAKERQIKELRERLDGMTDRIAQLRDRRAQAGVRLADGDRAGAAALLGDRSLTAMARDLETAGDAAPEALRARFDARAQSALKALDAEIERAEGQAQLMRDSIARLEEEVRVQSRDLVELLQLQREAEASRLIYEHFLSRMKETSVQQGIQQADARVLSPAIAPAFASEPRTRRIIAVALVGGLLVSIVIVLIIAQLRTTIQSREELEALTGETVMGVIPAGSTRKRKALMEYMVRKPSSKLAEAIRNLRTAILMSDLDSPPQVVMVCSSAQGEGKTTTALLLAQNSAMLGRRVLAIECDLRRNVFRSYFDADRKPGLMAVLSGQASLDDAIIRDPATGLHVIAGERSEVNAADVFSSDRFGELMAEMRGRYDHIFVDTPPVLAVPDARVISRHVDAILFAVKWNSTTREMVTVSLDLFRQVNAHITGLVLTQADTRRMARYGYYGYGYGHGQRRSERYYSN